MSKRINYKVWEQKVRPKLKKQFEEMGITQCEIRFIGCTNGMFTGFAHSKRRRDIYTEEDMEEVILACQHCHGIIDGQYPDPLSAEKVFWSKEKCTEFVKGKIAERLAW